MNNNIPISYLTYRAYALRYGIRLTKNKKKKTMKELSDEIRKYEMKNKVNTPLLIYYTK
jgi:hypothetical protein